MAPFSYQGFGFTAIIIMTAFLMVVQVLRSLKELSIRRAARKTGMEAKPHASHKKHDPQ